MLYYHYVQVLYELVFAQTDIVVPFTIFELHPRKLIANHCLLSECNLVTAIVVVAEPSPTYHSSIFEMFPSEVCIPRWLAIVLIYQYIIYTDL